MSSLRAETFRSYALFGVVSIILSIALMVLEGIVGAYVLPSIISAVFVLLIVIQTLGGVMLLVGMLACARFVSDTKLYRVVQGIIVFSIVSCIYSIIAFMDPTRESLAAVTVILFVHGVLAIMFGVRIGTHAHVFGVYGKRIYRYSLISGILMLIPFIDLVGALVSIVVHVYLILLMYAIARKEVAVGLVD